MSCTGWSPGAKRAAGFELSDGMEVPEELAEKFEFARQKSKLAGTIRGSFFVIERILVLHRASANPAWCQAVARRHQRQLVAGNPPATGLKLPHCMRFLLDALVPLMRVAQGGGQQLEAVAIVAL